MYHNYRPDKNEKDIATTRTPDVSACASLVERGARTGVQQISFTRQMDVGRACEHRLRCKSNSIAAEKGSLARKGEESDNRKAPANRYTSEKMSQEHLIINQDNMEQKKNIPEGTAHGCGNW